MCGVIRTVISCPSDLIWDESATSLSNGEGLRRGEGNSSRLGDEFKQAFFLMYTKSRLRHIIT